VTNGIYNESHTVQDCVMVEPPLGACQTPEEELHAPGSGSARSPVSRAGSPAEVLAIVIGSRDRIFAVCDFAYSCVEEGEGERSQLRFAE
jgi:hypothetical protein